ncbi:MAG: DNA/RNA nuclease SfsA [Alphaproteobacteria bacterium]|nr:MAG: DNA/RNA nuclease SfsA [Alphaproteobacteria bacterium]
MKLPVPLIRGRLVRRYKRFLADVELDNGDRVTAHCANTGSMMGMNTPGLTVWLSKHDNPRRKLAYSWELVEIEGGLVGINTAYPNRIAAEAVAAGLIGELADYTRISREVPYGQSSRIDLLLQRQPGACCYVEVKNVNLCRKSGLAEFPDAVTARGLKHLQELSRVVKKGGRAVMLFVVQRQDCHHFALAGDIDPAYKSGFEAARAQGVEALCYACRLTTEEIILSHPLEMVDE